MRPVRRGKSPQTVDFTDYADAQPHLISRIGRYCSYCERPILTSLAVEHIQPKKGPHAHPHLEGCWTNYLLACVNCNSTKKDKNVELTDSIFPDRDNTFAAFSYSPNGEVTPTPGLLQGITTSAENTLALTGLDKKICVTLDENDKQVAIDRVSQRMEAWAVAQEAKADIVADPNNVALMRATIRTAQGYGFFSIWMEVFSADTEMRNLLIDAFVGTRASGCFDVITTLPVSPAPNPDGLDSGSKI